MTNNSTNIKINLSVKFELNDFLSEINNSNYTLYRDILEKSSIENDTTVIENIFNNISKYTTDSDFFDFMKFILDKIYENDSIQHTKPINIVYPISGLTNYYY